MRRMTVTEGLAELKLLDERIKKAIAKDFVWSGKKSAITSETTREHKALSESAYASAADLIENRKKIKSAIVQSNAITMVTVGTKVMTVADAIERKSSIEYDKMLRDTLVRQYKFSEKNVLENNDRVQDKIDSMLEKIASSASADIESAQKVMSEAYLANNGWEIIDPIEALAKAEALDHEITAFERDVDVALSVSNAVTFIEV